METDNIDPEQLYGTWQLVETTAVDRDGDPLPEPYGPQKMGRLVLERSGRMMAVLCDGRPRMPTGMARPYSSYVGNFVFDGSVLTTTVDGASDPARMGTLQRRGVAFRGGRLVLTPPRRPSGEQRTLSWELVAAG